MAQKHDAVADAREWVRGAPPRVVVMVREAIRRRPTLRALRRGLDEALLASDDPWTTIVVMRCQDQAYANAFGRALLRAK
jgi:hypothetical protein